MVWFLGVRIMTIIVPHCTTAPVGQGPLIIHASRWHSDTPHSVGRLWTSDRPDAQTSTWQHTKFTRDRHPFPPAGFEPATPTGVRPQNHVLDAAVNVNCVLDLIPYLNCEKRFIGMTSGVSKYTPCRLKFEGVNVGTVACFYVLQEVKCLLEKYLI